MNQEAGTLKFMKTIDQEPHYLRADFKTEALVCQKCNLKIGGLATQTRLRDQGNRVFIDSDGSMRDRSHQNETWTARRGRDRFTKRSMDSILES
jgi:hypothetical protein